MTESCDEKPYAVYHSTVDGAGFVHCFATVDEAKAEADRLQVGSDQGGNTWGYRYAVFGNSDRCLYRTRVGAPPDREAER